MFTFMYFEVIKNFIMHRSDELCLAIDSSCVGVDTQPCKQTRLSIISDGLCIKKIKVF